MTSLVARIRPLLGAIPCPYHADVQLFYKRPDSRMLYKVCCPWFGCEYDKARGDWHEEPQNALEGWNTLFDPGKTDK